MDLEDIDEYQQKLYMQKIQAPKFIRENKNLWNILSGQSTYSSGFSKKSSVVNLISK